MFASQIVARARSLADVPNSLYISHDDEVNSLYESYRDVYSKITDSSYDYYIISVIIDTSTSIQLGINEWQVAIPADVYKIRFVNYNNNGRWVSMDHFSDAVRNDPQSTPKYRWRGNSLWIIGSSTIGLPQQIRLEYYKQPIIPSTPETPIQYASSYIPSNLIKITSPYWFNFYTPNNDVNTDYMVYIYNSNSIVLESNSLSTTTSLYTNPLATIDMVQYYSGYIYYLTEGDVYRTVTDLLTPFTSGTRITFSTAVTTFTVLNNKMYYYDTNYKIIKITNVDGTNVQDLVVLDNATTSVSDISPYSAKIAYIRNGFLVVDVTRTALAIEHLTAHEGLLYYSDSAYVLHRCTAEAVDATGPNDDYVLAADVLYMGKYSISGNRLPVQKFEYVLQGMSAFEDTDFDYPLNAAYEITAYQSAIDFMRKAKGDTTQLEVRLAKIIARFENELRRDDYRPERRAAETRNRSGNW